jgi:hypothetical protein
MKRPGLIIKSTMRNDFAPTKRNIILLYGFLITWSISTSIIFILFSKKFTSRYFHIPAFAINALLVISIFSIFAWFFPRRKSIYTLALLVLILWSGYARYTNLKNIYTYYNKMNEPIANRINQIKYPEDSQIVIVGFKKRNKSKAMGNWGSSSGYLALITRRKDVTGIVGKEHSYYDPFIPLRGSGYRNIMTGLSLNKPLFLFKILPQKKKIIQMEYFLRWRDRTKNARWVLYRTDKKSGKIIRIKSGRGFLTYRRLVKKIGLKKSVVLWNGSFPSKKGKKEPRVTQDQVTKNRFRN